MRVSRIVANKAKIPLQAATCAALAAHPGDAGGTGDPGESLNKPSRGVLGFLSSPTKSALAPRQGSVAQSTVQT